MVSSAGLVSAKMRARKAVPTILATTNTCKPSRPCPRAISPKASSLKGSRIAAGMRKATIAAWGGRPAMRASHQRTPGSLPSHAMQACMASHTHSSRKIHSAAKSVSAPRSRAARSPLGFPRFFTWCASARRKGPGAALRRVRLRTRSAFLDRLSQLLPELRRVLVAVDRNRVLHGDFHELFLAVRGYRDRALRFARKFPASDKFSGHGFLLYLVPTAT